MSDDKKLAEAAEVESALDKKFVYYFVKKIDEASAEALCTWLEQSMYKQLDCNIRTPIRIMVNSPGGGLHESLMIYDCIQLLKTIGIPVYTVVIGECSSGASLFIQAGTRRFAMPQAEIMIHELSWGYYGNFSEHALQVSHCARQLERMSTIYAKHTGKPIDIIKEDIKLVDKYFSAQEALEYGLIDSVFGAEMVDEC